MGGVKNIQENWNVNKKKKILNT